MTLVQKEVTAVYIWRTPISISDMQGPCPDGFHVPTKDEFSALYSAGVSLGIWGERSGAGLNTYLKMPFAGWRSNSSSNVENQGTVGGYWVCTVRDGDYAYNMYLSATYNMDYNFTHYGEGSSIRAFKDKVEIPDSSWTALYSDKVYHNSNLGLISISADGTNWITIQDKNVGATTVYNSGDTLSEANCGKYFQWGNNYGFPFTGSVTTSSTKVNAGSYGPGNYYSSSTFITGSGNWSSSRNDNLRGGVSQGTTTEGGDIKIRPTTPPIAPVNETFSYTGSDQTWTVPYTQDYIITCKGAGSRSATGGLARGTITLTAGDTLSIMVGATGYNGNGTKYGFGGSANGGSNAAGGGLSGVFTGSGTITASDSARALVIGGGAGGSSAGTGGVGGGTTGGTGAGSYGTAGGGGTQTGRGSGGNTGSGQFQGGNGSGTYGYGGGGGWRGGNGSIGDSSADDDKGGGGGSGYVISTATDTTLTAGGGASAGGNGSVTIVSVYQG